jgi:hypothetical protein
MKKESIYIRTVDGGGLWIRQLIIGPLVFGISHNRSAFNGKVGWGVHIKKRKNTDL